MSKMNDGVLILCPNDVLGEFYCANRIGSTEKMT